MMNDSPLSGDACGADTPVTTPEPVSIPLNPAIASLLASAVSGVPNAAPGKILSPEAIRALEEADARRKAAPQEDLPLEWDGRGGEEPTRFGDWERRGLATDF
jgi:hypothetical protein